MILWLTMLCSPAVRERERRGCNRCIPCAGFPAVAGLGR
jgi:hypothetical protein